MAGLCTKILLMIIALFIPPLAVWIARDKICSGTVSINILLTLLAFVPGVIHAWCIVCCCENL